MTYYLLLFGALALAVAGLLVRRYSSALGNALAVLGVLGCGACIAWQVRQIVFTPDAGPDRGQAVVSYFLAQQVLGEVANKQGSVLLFFPPDSVMDEDTVGTYAGTFQRVVRGFPNLKVEVITLEVPRKAARAGQINLDLFQQAASKTSPVVAYVSFAGVPADIEKLPVSQPGAGFYVFDPWGTTNWLSALRSGRVRSVVVPRPGLPRGASEEASGEPHDVFHRLYLMGTPATANQLADQLKTK